MDSPSGREGESSSILLYQREDHGPFTFAWALRQCHIREGLEDAGRIVFYGGPRHTLCVRNSGAATLYRGREILLRNKKYALSYGETLSLVLGQGGAVFHLRYENIKPSERKW